MNANRTLEASAQRVGGARSPLKLVLSGASDRDEDSQHAHVLGRVPARHEEASPEERPVWFPGEAKYNQVEIVLPAARRAHEVGVVLNLWGVEAILELRKLLDEAEAKLAERYAPPVEHREAAGWQGGEAGSCGLRCTCGVAFDGFDTLGEAAEQLAKHTAATESGEPR